MEYEVGITPPEMGIAKRNMLLRREWRRKVDNKLHYGKGDAAMNES